MLKRKSLLITDNILGHGNHKIEVIFPLSPKTRILSIKDKIIKCDHHNNDIYFKFIGNGYIECKKSYFNSSFGYKEKNLKLVFNVKKTLPTKILTEVSW